MINPRGKRTKAAFGRHIRDARIKRKLRVDDVAEQIGVTHQAVYYWECGHVLPRPDNFAALCRALKLPLASTQAMVGWGDP